MGRATERDGTGKLAAQRGVPPAGGGQEWPPTAVRRLRAHLGLSQAALAQRLGTRQQTISEWETGTRAPRRMSRRLLHLVAEEAGFYAAGGATGEPLLTDGAAAAEERGP